MHVSFNRNMIRFVILLCLPTTAFFIGCKNDMSADVSDMVIETEETESVENKKVSMEADIDTMDIYERFLNGKLTVEWRGEQVFIAELFWDNEISYCFYDIDSDGSEELHIKDSVAYYAIKVCDNVPQIFFDGWWGYEPVVLDGKCGILHYYHGYGNEQVEFMTMTADGSTERDGEFYWSDTNMNGAMDETDYFRGFTSWEEIDMGRYVRYRDKQLAMLSGSELEWKERKLEEFATWQDAYVAYIERRDSIVSEYVGYSLIYVDNDEIPELYIDTGGMATGEFVVSFYEGNIGIMNRERVGLRYIEYGGLLYSESGSMGFYPCNIYRLEGGKFSEIGTGWYWESYDGENIDRSYFWEGSPVTETAYEAYKEEMIDTTGCIEPSSLYAKEEILEILKEREMHETECNRKY